MLILCLPHHSFVIMIQCHLHPMKNAIIPFLLLFPCLVQALVQIPKPSILLWEIVEYGGELGYEMENQNGDFETIWNYHVKTGYDLTFQIVGLNLGNSLDGKVQRIAATSNDCFQESISFTATKLGVADRFLIFHLKFNGKNYQKTYPANKIIFHQVRCFVICKVLNMKLIFSTTPKPTNQSTGNFMFTLVLSCGFVGLSLPFVLFSQFYSQLHFHNGKKASPGFPP